MQFNKYQRSNMKEYKIKAIERNEWFFKVKAKNEEDAQQKAHKKWEENNFSFENMESGKTNTFFVLEGKEQ